MKAFRFTFKKDYEDILVFSATGEEALTAIPLSKREEVEYCYEIDMEVLIDMDSATRPSRRDASSVIHAVCDYFGITVDKLREMNRSPSLVEARKIIALILKDDLKYRNADIADVLHKAKATISDHIKSAREMVEENAYSNPVAAAARHLKAQGVMS